MTENGMSVQELEKQRKKSALIIPVVFAIWVISVLLAFWYFGKTENPLPLFICWLGGGFGVFFLTYRLYSRYSRRYKEIFARKTMEEVFDGVNYEPERGIAESDFASAGIYRKWDTYSSENYVSGKYKGVFFEQADIIAQTESQTTDSDGNSETSHSPIFVGRWMIFDYNKSFRSTVKVLERFPADFLLYVTNSEGYQQVSLENEAFNKKYHTYSTSEQDAFYLLTPQMMEALLHLETVEKGRIVLLFRDSKLHVGLNDGKKSFSPGFFSMFRKIDEEKIHEKLMTDIRVIMDFADSLRLDNDLFQNTGA